MKVLQINSYNFGSTGNIMIGIAEQVREQGHECVTACPDGRSMRVRQLKNHLYIGNPISRNAHIKLAEYTGLNGCFSAWDTWLFLQKVKTIKPDVVHLHNLHNCYINLPMLFRFLKRKNIPVVWTLHDCWAFTGKCPHFDMVGCDRWKDGCYDCPQLAQYPATHVDKTAKMWGRKKKWFSSPGQLTIVTPSEWLGNLVRQSFLGGYEVRVIPNGTDFSVFQPTNGDFRKNHGLEDKYILLGVAFEWNQRKGLDVFESLAGRLDERFQLVLVGVNNEIAKKLPSNIIAIPRTRNATELAELYTAADLLVNPTREEVLGMVNLESLGCGTPVVTFRTGGSPETITPECGSVVDKDDIDALEREIIRICEEKPYSSKDCRRVAARFDKRERFAEYCALYEEIYGK